MDGIRLGLVGIGKIARDQHVPALANDARFTLSATASRNGRVDGVQGY
ncbi:MAG: gfo/Idh/MocA family oxidoreductase, partial [Sphingomonadales bacterium]